MPEISFVADEDDFKIVVNYLSDRPDLAFIVGEGPGHWRAVPTLDSIEVDRIALWHVPSGPLPLPQKARNNTGETIPDPWRGWSEIVAGADKGYPYFGSGHPGIIWLHHFPSEPGTSHGVGISWFGWIGNYWWQLGRRATPATNLLWSELRAWIRRQTKPRASAGDSRAFPSAMAKIRAAAEASKAGASASVADPDRDMH